MWLGEQITERGIGNGISLIIFAGIVARMPNAIASTFELLRIGQMNVVLILALLVLMVLVVAVISSSRRVNGGSRFSMPSELSDEEVYGGQSTHLPLKLNTSGVIPPIFASSILMFPLTDRELLA